MGCYIPELERIYIPLHFRLPLFFPLSSTYLSILQNANGGDVWLARLWSSVLSIDILSKCTLCVRPFLLDLVHVATFFLQTHSSTCIEKKVSR
jgi:hypothetical protein